MVRYMEDNSGTKFSLQEWVMKRAANQSGETMPPRSVASPPMTSSNLSRNPRALSDEPSSAAEVAEPSREAVETVSDPVVSSSSPSASVSGSIPASPTRMTGVASGVASVLAETLPSSEARIQSQTSPSIVAHPSPSMPSAAPLQQLQIVRLLQDLGDRLRQSEKEREILWRELETCRKLVADAEDKSSKAEKAYLSVEGQISKRETFVEELVERQARLEKALREQAEQIETSQLAQSKVQEKISSLETTAGSTIVRIEDALSENAKLNRRLEQIGQDKARLIRKMETMEEALTLTQDTLKAKALVLLTDQALAAKTSLPQTPAWTAPTPKPEPTATNSEALASITASLRKTSLWNQTALVTALIVLAIGGGVAYSKWKASATSHSQPAKSSSTSAASGQNLFLGEANLDEGKASPASTDPEVLMGQVANLANQIEPTAETAESSVADASFAKAHDAEQEAVKAFEQSVASGDLRTRIQPDSRLPASIKEIETRAFDGDGEAQHDLAAIYTAGRGGVRANYTRAAKWFEESAHNGIANAQYNLGVLYHQGLGVKSSLKKAIDLYRVASANGHPEAQYNLGIATIEGVGADYDPLTAARYFEKAAEGGIPEAAYNLGLIHENGLLGESQPDEAVFWYSLAAGKGNAPAKEALADLKKQISMTDEDAARLISRMVVLKPAFATENDGAALPEPDEKMQRMLVLDEKTPPKPVKSQTNSTSTKAAAETKVKQLAPSIDPVIVAQVQEQLIRLGLYNGAPDGVVSPKTETAVKAYQAANNLTVDGRPSEDVLVHILAAEVGTGEPAGGQEESPIPEIKPTTSQSLIRD